MYPPLRSLYRGCTKEYRIPDSDVTIEEGTLVLIPIHAIQMDPEIFQDPETFDPERFSPDRKKLIHPCHWMPFGEGPRKCLGLYGIIFNRSYPITWKFYSGFLALFSNCLCVYSQYNFAVFYV